MINKILVSTILIMGVSCYSLTTQGLPSPSFYNSLHVSNAEPSYQYKIIQAPENTWGYDILRDNNIFIHQPNRPGMPGTKGFTTKRDAIKVAALVVAKIKKGEMPPTVTVDELKGLKVQ